jgi:hypothetical protein
MSVEVQTPLNIEVQEFTDDQRKAARDALFMWDALPCNPVAVAGALHRALLAENAVGRGTLDVATSPAAFLINWALQGIMLPQGNICLVDIDVLVKAVDGCRKRVEGTEYDNPRWH